MIKRILLFNLILVGVLTAQQNFNFKNFAASEKLSNTRVSDFFQDSYGFMWMATSDGLNRYDGKSVKIYKNIQGDAESLPDNDTDQIVEDSDRNLWVACFNSIGKLDRKTDKFKRYNLSDLPFKSQPNVYSAMLDNEGRIWFSLSELGLIRYNKETDKFVNVELSGENKTWGEVHNIIQLRNGVILAADAANGLKKYNASTDRFETFNLKPGYSPKEIFDIYEGNNGNVWMTGNSKLIKYSPTQYIIKEINLAAHSRLRTSYDDHHRITEDFAGNLWVSVWTHGLFMVDKQLENIVQYTNDPAKLNSLPENRLATFYKDKYGIIWISSAANITQFDPNSNQFQFDPVATSNKNTNQAIIRSMSGIPDNNSKIVIGTNTEGLLTYNIDSKNISKIKFKDSAYKIDSSNAINDLDVDYTGNIWFSINNSPLKMYDPKSKKIQTVESPHTRKTAQPLRINSIDISPNNEVWITSNQGIDRYNPQTKSFTSLPRIMNKIPGTELQENMNSIRKEKTALASILKVGEGQNLESKFTLDQKSSIVLIGLGEGRADNGMFDKGSLSDATGKTLWEMSDIYETFYAGGGFKNRSAIKILDLPKGEYQLNFTSDIGHSFGNYNVIAPADSNYWGIEAYQTSQKEAEELTLLIEKELDNSSHLPFEAGRAVEFSKKFSNTIWIGTFTNSFFRYNTISSQYTQFNFDKSNLTDASHFINSIYEDIDGIVWVGTYASLVRLDPQSDEFKVFSTSEGLPGGIIYSITEDNNEALWIHSSGGLSKLNKNAPIDEFVFVTYDSYDGIEGITQSGAVWKNEKGKLFFGGKGGIISFMPGKINTILPDIVIHDFKIDDISIYEDSSDFVLQEGIYEAELIELPHDQNNISFEFSAIHFSRPDKNKINYQLEGFNSKWYESDRNFASFTNLDPGEYVFRVKGSNGDGIWNEEGSSVRIKISPPWWQTTIAYIMYFVLFGALIFTIDRLQRRRLLAKERAATAIKEAELRAQLAEAENDRKSLELEEARQLQLSMLPKELPQLPNLDIAVYMQTATEVGGDYYDFHVGLDGTLTVVIGDATGHGMRAGTMVTTAKSLFNSYAPNPDILYSFQEITRCIKQMNFGKLSMCMTMLKIKGDKMQISTAGMPPSLIFRRETRVVEEHLFKAMPLGAMENFPYEIKDTTLESGDTILLMSDGLPELANAGGDMYGYKKIRNGFEDVAEKSPEEIVSYLKNEGADWVNNEDPDDDVTFVVIKVK